MEILSYALSVGAAARNSISSSCVADKSTFSTTQVKEVLKSVVQMYRFIKRAVGTTDVVAVCEPHSWEEVANQLATSMHYKSSASLRDLCGQVCRLVHPLTVTTREGIIGKRRLDTKESVIHSGRQKRRKAGVAVVQ